MCPKKYYRKYQLTDHIEKKHPTSKAEETKGNENKKYNNKQVAKRVINGETSMSGILVGI